MSPNSSAKIEAFFDPDTFTVTYVVADPATDKCAIIDSVLDYDPDSGRTSTASADKVIKFIKDNHVLNAQKKKKGKNIKFNCTDVSE